MITIKVYEITGERAVLDSDGDIVYMKLQEAFDRGESVTLDFADVTTILSIFTNSAIAQLYTNRTSAFLNQHLKIVNMSADDLVSLKRVIDRGKEFYSSPDEAQAFLEGEIFCE